MKVIRVKAFNGTTYKPTRYKASEPSGNNVTLTKDFVEHRTVTMPPTKITYALCAARRLMNLMEWKGELEDNWIGANDWVFTTREPSEK